MRAHREVAGGSELVHQPHPLARDEARDGRSAAREACLAQGAGCMGCRGSGTNFKRRTAGRWRSCARSGASWHGSAGRCCRTMCHAWRFESGQLRVPWRPGRKRGRAGRRAHLEARRRSTGAPCSCRCRRGLARRSHWACTARRCRRTPAPPRMRWAQKPAGQQKGEGHVVVHVLTRAGQPPACHAECPSRQCSTEPAGKSCLPSIGKA